MDTDARRSEQRLRVTNGFSAGPLVWPSSTRRIGVHLWLKCRTKRKFSFVTVPTASHRPRNGASCFWYGLASGYLWWGWAATVAWAVHSHVAECRKHWI